jgi:hypothetical protein
MKECPICHAHCFDDMDVCYGCMHRFVTADAVSQPSVHAPESEQAVGAQSDLLTIPLVEETSARMSVKVVDASEMQAAVAPPAFAPKHASGRIPLAAVSVEAAGAQERVLEPAQQQARSALDAPTTVLVPMGRSRCQLVISVCPLEEGV